MPSSDQDTPTPEQVAEKTVRVLPRLNGRGQLAIGGVPICAADRYALIERDVKRVREAVASVIRADRQARKEVNRDWSKTAQDRLHG